MGWDCLPYNSYWLRDHFLLVARSDYTTRSRNRKPEVVLKVQKMARYASFCLIMGLFKREVPVFARYGLFGHRGVHRDAVSWAGNIRVGVRVSFTTGAVRSAIIATAGLLVHN